MIAISDAEATVIRTGVLARRQLAEAMRGSSPSRHIEKKIRVWP